MGADCVESRSCITDTSLYRLCNVTHYGRHNVVITNCTGGTARFTVEFLLQSEEGGFSQVIEDHDIADQMGKMLSHDSSYALWYPNPGSYTVTAETTVSGPVNDKVISTAIVTILFDG